MLKKAFQKVTKSWNVLYNDSKCKAIKINRNGIHNIKWVFLWILIKIGWNRKSIAIDDLVQLS